MSEASKGYRYSQWRAVTNRTTGLRAGERRERGRNVEYRNTGAQGTTYGGAMRTLAARNHGKTKRVTLQKRNVNLANKNEM